MKRIYIYIAAMACSVSMMAQQAQDVTPADSAVTAERVRKPLLSKTMENAVVVQDSAITMLMEHIINGTNSVKQMQGFRVQIFSSNRQQTAKAEALELERQILAEGGVQVYVQYNPPFWKVRLGNFQTQEEATEYKNEFVKQHPQLQGDTYIVRDMIEVIQ